MSNTPSNNDTAEKISEKIQKEETHLQNLINTRKSKKSILTSIIRIKILEQKLENVKNGENKVYSIKLNDFRLFEMDSFQKKSENN
jgi:hypothetical protein